MGISLPGPLTGRRGPRWFNDKNVYAEDLTESEFSQSYGLKALAASMTSQYGVCINSLLDSGMQVTVTSANFSVAPGRAVDGYGNTIYIPAQYSSSGGNSQIGTPGEEGYVPAGTYPKNQLIKPSTSYDTHYITVEYAHVSGSYELDDEGSSHGTRVYDSYIIRDLQNLPSGSLHRLVLAKLMTSSGVITSIQDMRTPFSTYSQANTTSLETHQRYLHHAGLISPDGAIPYSPGEESLGVNVYYNPGENADYLQFAQLGVPTGGTSADMLYCNGKLIAALQGELTFNYEGTELSGSYHFYVQEDGTIGYDRVASGYYIPPTEATLDSANSIYYIAGGHYNPEGASNEQWHQVGGVVGLQDLRRYYGMRASQIRNRPSGSLTSTDVQQALYWLTGQIGQEISGSGIFVRRVGDSMTGALQLGTSATPYKATDDCIRVVPTLDAVYQALVVRNASDNKTYFSISKTGSVYVYDQGASINTVVGIGYADPGTGRQGAVWVADGADPSGTATGIRPSSYTDGIGVHTKGKIYTDGGIGGPGSLYVNPSRQIALRHGLPASDSYVGCSTYAYMYDFNLAPSTWVTLTTLVMSGWSTIKGVYTSAGLQYVQNLPTNLDSIATVHKWISGNSIQVCVKSFFHTTPAQSMNVRVTVLLFGY